MKRLIDVFGSLLLLLILLFPIFVIAILIKFNSKGPIIHFSKRIGLNNKIFKMPKFRTMHLNAPNVATHLLKNPNQHLTPVGPFLRKTSLDEIPQLWSILIGDMSFVGPRPALFNQYDLVKLRTSEGVDHLIPGLTGWAQVNGRDALSIAKKVNFDKYLLFLI